MLTNEEFQKIPKNTIFRTGIVSNSPTGVFMTNDPNLPFLKYVIVKGWGDDWTIYFGKPTQSDEAISSNGDKSHSLSTISLCISCDDEVKSKYRN